MIRRNYSINNERSPGSNATTDHCNGKSARAVPGTAAAQPTTTQPHTGGLIVQLLNHASHRRLGLTKSDKKLSVVPEQDEQQTTVTSITQVLKGIVTGRGGHAPVNSQGSGSGGQVGGGSKGEVAKVVSLAKVRREQQMAEREPIKEERCVEDVMEARRRKHRSGMAEADGEWIYSQAHPTHPRL